MNDNAAVAVLPTSNLPAVSADTQAFDLQLRKAKVFAASSLVPQQYRNNLPDCVIAMNMANRIGADVLQVMQSLYIVQGRPAWSAQFLIASFNACGRFSAMRFEWQGAQGKPDWGCRATATEKATGELLCGPWVTWKMAESEGWTKKAGSKWLTMPAVMFGYRAASFFVKMYAPEITMGLQTAEEVIDITPAAGNGEQAQTKADAIANALRTRAVDTATGEIEVPQPPDPNAGKGLHLYTYAEVRDRLENAQTDDDRALAVDMIRSVQDEAQRAELTELAKLLADAPR